MSLKTIHRFLYITTCRLNIKKSSKAAKVETLVKFFNTGKTFACYGCQACDIEFLKPSFTTYSCIHVSFSEASKSYQRINKYSIQKLEIGNNNFLFWLRVWLFGRQAKTSLNQFESKLQGNWNCSASEAGT